MPLLRGIFSIQTTVWLNTRNTAQTPAFRRVKCWHEQYTIGASRVPTDIRFCIHVFHDPFILTQKNCLSSSCIFQQPKANVND